MLLTSSGGQCIRFAVPEVRVFAGRTRALVTAGKIAGPRIHDAHIAALCREHGVRELWSADRDFNRFPDLNVVNPLTA